MEDLFSHTALKCSQLITQSYSTSFTLGIKTLHKSLHLPIYAIYGYVRFADEIVDTFHGFDKKELLDRFKKDTFQAIDEGISLNPVLHSFQIVINKYQIDHALILAFLKSMEMDLTNEKYAQEGYEEYIYGSAEVVGLMCLMVFCDGDKEKYNQLKAPAKSLGAAFQKVNFLRDLKSDFQDRGRIYFPNVDFSSFNNNDKIQIENDIETDFKNALEGILNLPKTSKPGVFLAYTYYYQLFNKIKKQPPKSILTQRIRIPNTYKLVLLGKTLLMNKFNWI
jgi:15-cis-phytoene synthase